MTLPQLLVYTLYPVMFITLIISLLFCYRKQNPSYLQFFPFYHLFACCIEAITGLYFTVDHSLLRLGDYSLYNLFTLVEFLFFFFFILTQLTRRMYKLILWGAGITALVLLSSFVLSYRSLDFPVWQGVMTTNLFYILGCILYFLNILKDLPYADLSKEPSFWIMAGLFFYAVIEGPTIGIILNYNPLFVSSILYKSMNGIAYIILHLLFIKAYTCKIKDNGSSRIYNSSGTDQETQTHSREAMQRI